MSERKSTINVLVVEDDPNLNRAYLTLFRLLNCKVTGVHDVTGALEEIQRSDAGRLDMIVVDYWLPDGEGTEVIEAVRAQIPATKIVVMTAVAEGKIMEKIENSKPDLILHKPYGFDRMEKLVDELRGK